MVNLSITSSMVEAITYGVTNKVENWPFPQDEERWSAEKLAVGQPISHDEVIALSRCLKTHVNSKTKSVSNKQDQVVHFGLDDLLRGSRVYVEPPKPKPKPTLEYQALMARLREEEEARAYERMINPPLRMETFEQRFPASGHAHMFSRIADTKPDEEDEVTYSDVNRQMAVIVNVLVSIIACSIAIWMVASRWTTPQRLALSMSGSLLVGTAEVVVYAGYLRRVTEAKSKAKKKVEVKEIIKTWEIRGTGKDRDVLDIPSLEVEKPSLRQRAKKTKD